MLWDWPFLENEIHLGFQIFQENSVVCLFTSVHIWGGRTGTWDRV